MIQPKPITLNARTAGTLSILIGALIVCVGSFAHYVKHQVVEDTDSPLFSLLSRFDIVNEPSLLQWYASSLHLVCCSLLAVCAVKASDRWLAWRWLGLAVVFLFASIDEAIMLHEMLDNPTRQLLGTSGVLTIAWIIPGAVIALMLAGLYIKFLIRLESMTRWRFVVAGMIFLSGAILMELPGGWLYEKYGFSTSHYIISYAVEELLELAGMSLFLFALMDFLGRNYGAISVPVGVQDQPSTNDKVAYRILEPGLHNAD